MHYVVRGLKGAEAQNFYHLCHKMDKHFVKQHLEDDAKNKVQNNIQPSEFCYLVPIRRKGVGTKCFSHIVQER